MMGFGQQLALSMDEFGPLSVGIDPSPEMLSHWGLPDTAEGALTFGQAVVEACDRSVAAVKIQIAFFERYGARGIAALEQVLAAAKNYNLITIMDAKRGDIDSSMSGYAEAYLKPGAPLEVDAMTVSPFLGFGSLKPALSLAAQHGKGVFVLCLTSNPEGPTIQHARDEDGVAVATSIAAAVGEWNQGAVPMGDVGLVIGATTGDAVRTLPIPLYVVNGPILSPGVGAQGAGPEQLAQVFGPASRNVLAHQSRAVLHAGPFVEKLRGEIRAAAGAAQYALRGE
ncbi:MAG: orotidine-5'-phosphate decarboxylase [Demequinaceae bacterium]|nr:orotidine-5'-phosphate decarboxylase [Demequinaceae bacterium]